MILIVGGKYLLIIEGKYLRKTRYGMFCLSIVTLFVITFSSSQSAVRIHDSCYITATSECLITLVTATHLNYSATKPFRATIFKLVRGSS